MNAVDPNTWTGAKVSTTSAKSPQLSFHTLTHSDQKILPIHMQTVPFENHILQTIFFYLRHTSDKLFRGLDFFLSLTMSWLLLSWLIIHPYLPILQLENAVDIWINIVT